MTAEHAGQDIVLRIATINGTGSQSANLTVLRALHRRGLMVSGKNLFPSNIAGLPTWFTLRVSQQGWRATRRAHQLTVCMNPKTAHEDIALVAPGGLAIVDARIQHGSERDDIDIVAVPVADLVKQACDAIKLRKLVINMIYAGILGHLLDIDDDDLLAGLTVQFATKPKAVDLNLGAIAAGRAWAAENLGAPRFPVGRSEHAAGTILVEGNRAGAAGAVFGGVQFAAWYPITPSSSFAEALESDLNRHRRDVDGKTTYAIVQAEDELAAAGMVLGAGWAGARALTTTSGPGISLMSEYIGFGATAEIPGVFVNVQRMGPSTGMPTRTSQGDLFAMVHCSHGDSEHPVLIPSEPKEFFEMTGKALDLSERLQTPVFVAADLDLGMNWWVAEPFVMPTEPLDRGKVVDAETLAERGSFARYADPDGDGIPERTIPGTASPFAGYFTRGTGHDESAKYSEHPQVYTELLERWHRKIEDNRHLLPEAAFDDFEGTDLVVYYGTSRWAVHEARAELNRAISCLRIKAWPPSDSAAEIMRGHERVFVVEQNRDGQMRRLLAARYPDLAMRMQSILQYDGWPLTVETVVEGLEAAI